MVGKIIRAAAPPVLMLVILLVGAELATRLLGISRILVPPPSVIGKAFWDNAGGLAAATLVTGESAVAGFLLAGVVGMLVAILFSSSRIAQRALYPYTVFFQTVPIIAIAPLLVIWLGNGFRAVAAAAFIVSIFPVIANTLEGLRSTDPALVDLFKLYGAGPPMTLFKLRLPAALPNIFTGLKIAAGLAVIGAIVGEFSAGYAEGGAGLGITILEANRHMRTDRMFAEVLMASLLGLAMFTAVQGAAYLTLRRWHASEQ